MVRVPVKGGQPQCDKDTIFFIKYGLLIYQFVYIECVGVNVFGGWLNWPHLAQLNQPSNTHTPTDW